MKPITAIFLILFLATACRKQADQGPGKRQLMPPSRAASLSLLQDLLPANPQNPLDSAGIIHNRLLAGAQRYVLETGDTSLSSVLEHIAAAQQKRTPLAPVAPLAAGIPERVRSAFPYRVLTRTGKAPDLSGFSTSVQRYGSRLFEVLTDGSGLNYSRIRAGLVAIEKDILTDAALTAGERGALLQTAAIARYSAHYWISWAGSAQGRLVLYKGYNSPVAITVAVMAMYQADCWAMWYCYAWGLIQDPGVSADDILLMVSWVSTAAFIMTLNAM